jgi:hypothetical protein
MSLQDAAGVTGVCTRVCTLLSIHDRGKSRRGLAYSQCISRARTSGTEAHCTVRARPMQRSRILDMVLLWSDMFF